MAEQTTPLTVRFDALGRETRNIQEWSIDSDYLTSTDTFSFTYVDDARENLRGLECTPVTLLVGDAPQLVGRIDITERGQSSITVTCQGRDYFADLVECNVDPLVQITEGMTLQAALKLILSPSGINVVLGDASIMRKARSGARPGGRGSPPDFLALTQQELRPEPEQGQFEFANQLVARHGATLQPTLARNEALVQAPDYGQDPLYTLARSLSPGSTQNRIKSATAVRDFARFPTYTFVRGLSGDAADKEKQPANSTFLRESAALTPETLAVSVKGRRKPVPHGPDPDGKLYRLLSLHDQKARTSVQINAAAFRAIWDRLKDTLLYKATIRGHRDPDSGALWTIDTIVNIQDEVCEVNEPMWIHKRKFSYSPSNGAETEIECWRIGALQLGASA